MSDDRESATLLQDEHRDMPSEDERVPMSADQSWMSDAPHSGSTFSFRVQPDRRRSLAPIDAVSERRRR